MLRVPNRPTVRCWTQTHTSVQRRDKVVADPEIRIYLTSYSRTYTLYLADTVQNRSSMITTKSTANQLSRLGDDLDPISPAGTK